MTKFTIKSSHLVGFVAEGSKPEGTKVLVRTKCNLVTSDKPIFHVWMKHISLLFFSKTSIPISLIHKFLIVLHNDDTADIYINDFREIARVKIKESVKAGEKVFLDNISDISGLTFPDIEIKNDDAILYGLRTDWRFSLYFDFGRKIDREILTEELGELKKEAAFYALYASADAQIGRAEIEDADALVFMEGKSDWKHLSRAAENLGIPLNLAFWTDEKSVGSDDLYKMCEHYARIPQSKKMIFIFDRDEKPIIKRLQKKEKNRESYQDWGNNVYSLYLPVPLGRSDDTHSISMEFFYADDAIKTKNVEGRRLYLSNEFNRKSGNHISEDSHCAARNKFSRNKICIIDSDVFDRHNNSIALSKDDFAEAVLTREANFESFNYSAFQSIFNLISLILKK